MVERGCAPRSLGRRGMSLVELLMSMGILVSLMAVTYTLLGNAQTMFYDMSQATDLRDSLRQAMQKVELEVRNTGYDANGNAEFLISAGTGVNGSDVLRFSVPILCSATATMLDPVTGEPANWGAGLTWGCHSSTCMDANNSCTTLEYKHVQYALDNSSQLVRRVLGPTFATVATAVVAQNITALKFSVNNTTRILTVTMTERHLSGMNRVVTETVSQNVRLMN